MCEFKFSWLETAWAELIKRCPRESSVETSWEDYAGLQQRDKGKLGDLEKLRLNAKV